MYRRYRVLIHPDRRHFHGFYTLSAGNVSIYKCLVAKTGFDHTANCQQIHMIWFALRLPSPFVIYKIKAFILPVITKICRKYAEHGVFTVLHIFVVNDQIPRQILILRRTHIRIIADSVPAHTYFFIIPSIAFFMFLCFSKANRINAVNLDLSLFLCNRFCYSKINTNAHNQLLLCHLDIIIINALLSPVI